jgi:hypothetical protein
LSISKPRVTANLARVQAPLGAKFDVAAASTKSLSEQAMSVGKDLTDKAKDLAGNSTDALKDHASDFVDAAKDAASQATDKLKDAVNDRKSSGAEYVGKLANTMRRAAREFDNDLSPGHIFARRHRKWRSCRTPSEQAVSMISCAMLSLLPDANLLHFWGLPFSPGLALSAS